MNPEFLEKLQKVYKNHRPPKSDIFGHRPATPREIADILENPNHNSPSAPKTPSKSTNENQDND